MKTCSMCKRTLPLFNFNRKGEGWQGRCRECSRASYKKYYETGNEKQRLREKSLKQRAEIREFVNAVKDVPCTDCGVRYPYYVMQFDHLDPSIKEFDIAHGVRSKTLSAIKLEVLKCQVVCANCHMIRTHSKE